MSVYEVQAWCCSPVTQESGLDVLLAQRLLQERIVVEIDLADRQVVCGPPVRIELVQLIATERRILSRGANCSVRMACSIGANFLSFGYAGWASPLTVGASFGHWCGFSICFHVIFSRHVFIKKTVRPIYSPWGRLMAKPTNRCVSRMMAKSSRVAIT